MARVHGWLGTWQVLLTIIIFCLPFTVHGRHALGRRHHHHHNQSSVIKEALTPRMVLSDDSAERDHLISLGASLPVTPSKHHHSHKHAYLDFIEDDPPMAEELTAGGAGPDQPGNPMGDDVISVAFHSPAPDTVGENVAWAQTPQAQKQKPGGKQTTWSLNDFYDYADTDLSAVDPTPEPEPTLSPPSNMEDENPLLSGTPVVTEKAKPSNGASLPAPPKIVPGKDGGLDQFGAVGPDGCSPGNVRSLSGVCVSQCDFDPNFCLNDGVCTVVPGMGAFCRCNMQNYIWNKGTRCDQMVTEFQVMCAVVGVSSCVFLIFLMIIVFFAKRLHRLKSENKRLRKRSKYRPQSSEPQTDGLSVSTTADGSQPNVRKLCDTPPPAPQAHTHNLAYYDNIICQRPSTTSYTWEYKPRNPYNHFQDDPQKHNDMKSPQSKEDGSMNILNSHSPKHENNRPTSVGHEHSHPPNNTEESPEDGVTIGLEVLLPKEAKLHSDGNPPLQYDVYLYKVANNGDSVQTDAFATNIHPNSKSPKTFQKTPNKSPKHRSPKSPKCISDKSPCSREPLSERHSSPGHQHSPTRHPSPTRHSAPDCYSSPSSRHPPSHLAPSQYKCMASSSFTTTPPQLRKPRGRSQASVSPHLGHGAQQYQGRHIHPSPSSPHLTQPPPSPNWVKYSPVSTRSLPPLS